MTDSPSDRSTSRSTDLTIFDADAPLLLLGCGKMGGSLLDGWLARGLDPRAAVILDPQPVEALQNIDGLTLRTDGAWDGPRPRAVMLAVKPQIMEDAISAVTGFAGPEVLYISIAAGKPLAWFERFLGEETPIVRVMPNTPAAVGEGASALVGNGSCSEADRALASSLTDAAGISVWLDEEAQMDAVTGVSGSGPAYVFHLIEALAAAGEAEGLAPDLAMALARQTVIGAAALARERGDSAEDLRIAVTSPKGTTEAGLGVLMDEEAGLTQLVTRTVAAAAKRSRELAS